MNAVDINGCEISTHIDDEGRIIAVFNDGDKGIYQHNIKADGGAVLEHILSQQHDLFGPSASGKKIGETEYWDEFVNPETGKAMTNCTIQIGESFDQIIEDKHELSKNMSLC